MIITSTFLFERKHIMKKTFFIISLILCFNAHAQTSGNCGPMQNGAYTDSCRWEVVQNGTDNDGNPTYTLNVTGSGQMYTAYLNRPWESYRSSITEAVVGGQQKDANGNVTETGITTLGFQYAFHSMPNLQRVTLPDTLTSTSLGVFYMNNSLKSLTLPDSLTSIGYVSFWGTGLKSLFIPESVTSFGDSSLYMRGVVYCSKAQESMCNTASNYGGTLNNIKIYETDADGVYSITENDVTTYYASPDDMTHLNDNGDLAPIACESYDQCKIAAAQYQDAKAASMAGGALCDTKTACLGLMQMAFSKEFCNSIAACSKYTKDNHFSYMSKNQDGSYNLIDNEGNIVGYKGKRIYTVEEANKVSGKVNTVKLRYK